MSRKEEIFIMAREAVLKIKEAEKKAESLILSANERAEKLVGESAAMAKELERDELLKREKRIKEQKNAFEALKVNFLENGKVSLKEKCDKRQSEILDKKEAIISRITDSVRA